MPPCDAGDLAQRHQLVCVLEAVRRIDQGGGDPHRPGAHGLVDVGLHGLELILRRAAVDLAHHLDPRLRRAIVGGEVQRNPLPLQLLEIGGELGRGDRRAHLAGDGGGDALAQLVLGQTVAAEHLARLVHHVDPARGDVVAGGVELARAAALDPADPGETALADGDIGADPRAPLAIEHTAVADHQVIDLILSRHLVRSRGSPSRRYIRAETEFSTFEKPAATPFQRRSLCSLSGQTRAARAHAIPG